MIEPQIAASAERELRQRSSNTTADDIYQEDAAAAPSHSLSSIKTAARGSISALYCFYLYKHLITFGGNSLFEPEERSFMPARSERIHLFPDEDGQPGQVMEFPVWWDRSEFFNTYRHREIDLGGPIYVDYALLLTQGEAIMWDRQCRERFSRDPRSREPWFVSDMKRVESALKKARWVIVESYEWESGLD